VLPPLVAPALALPPLDVVPPEPELLPPLLEPALPPLPLFVPPLAVVPAEPPLLRMTLRSSSVSELQAMLAHSDAEPMPNTSQGRVI
jgi:hypothetical protein